MEPLKEFGKILLTLDNCIVPRERLLNTPSAKDGMTKDVEIDIRIRGCECIQSAGLLLKLPQAAMATAQILFQRFFYAKSLVKFNFYYAAMASLFLAAKIEECNRRLRDILNVFHHLKQKRKGSKPVSMDYVGEEYYRMRNTVIKYERYILKELGFCVHVQHPHKLVITCMQLLELEKNTPLVQKAWNLMNDSLRTNIFVRYEVKTIACTCIFLAARQVKVPLPEQPGWWRLFDVHIKDMKVISRELLTLYGREMRSVEELEREVEHLKESLMSMKKVEVREINMKEQPSDSSPAQSLSPSSLSPNVLQSIKTSPSKLEPNPVAGVSYRDPAHHTSPSNGVKRDRGEDSRNHSNKRPKPDSSPPHRTPEAYRPIHSPIKLSSDTEHSTTPSPQPNGYTITTRNDILEDTRKHHRHKHSSRSSKHHRHHHKDHQYHKHHRHSRVADDKPSSRSSREYARARKSEQYYYR